MIGSRCFAVLAVAGIGFGVGSAHAEQETSTASDPPKQEGTAEARQRAKWLYEDGLSAYRKGDYSTAVDKLLEADQVMPNAAFSYNIALVYEAMGDKRSALRWLRNFLRQSDKGSDQTATQTKMRRLEAELQAKGLQQVTILSNPPGATLKIDGQAAGLSPFTTEIAPGRHQATLVLDGYEPTQKTFDLRPDRSMDVEIKLEVAKTSLPKPEPTPVSAEAPKPTALQPAAPANDPGVSAPPSAERHRRSVQPWTWISLGVGTALFGGATYFELKRQKAEDDARVASQQDYQAQWDKIDPPKTTARVLVVAGSVVMATGLVLLTVDLTRSGPPRTASLGSCATNGLCAALRGQF